MIEKHFTDDRSKGGVDSAFSMDVADLTKLVKDAKMVSQALGVKEVKLQDDEWGMRNGRRSYYLVKPMKKGEVLTIEHVKSVRPALGLEPYLIDTLIGKSATRDLESPIPLKAEDFN